MTSQETIEQLVYNKFLCQESTLNFTRYFFKKQYNRKFVVGEHHKIICDALDKVISGEILFLIINIPPRYGKTELAVKNFIPYGLSVNPASKFIHLSYSDDLALDNSEAAKDLVTSVDYQQMFPSVRIKPGSDSKKKWYTTAGGGVYATSAAGQVTGFGAGRMDEIDEDFQIEQSNIFSGAMIIDDPIKPEEADSDVIRNRVNGRWDSTIKNRVNSRRTPIIIIMQRLHEEDLCGYVRNQIEGIHEVVLPALREDGSALWPFKHTSQELVDMRKANEVVFDRQYQQDPKPLEGILFKRGDLKRFKQSELTPDGMQCILGYCDVKDEGIDYLCFVFGKCYKGKVFITDVIYTQSTIDVTIPQSVAMIKLLDANLVRVEQNNQGGGFIRLLRQEIRVDKVLPVNHSKSKLSRIWNEYGFITSFFHFLDDSEIIPGSDYDKYLKNLCSFMKDGSSKVDDGADATAGLSRFIQDYGGTAKLYR